MEIAGRNIPPRTLATVAMSIAAILSFAGINAYLPGGGDNAAYIAEAEAWLKLGHRANLFEAGAPFDAYKPPLFSLMLAGVESIFGRNIVAMKAMLACFAAGSVWAAWWTLSAVSPQDQNRDRAAIIAFWFALCPSLSLYTHDVLSDVPFTFLVLLAAGCAVRARIQPQNIRATIALIAVLSASIFLRTAGIIVGGAFCVYFVAETVASWRQSDGSKRLAAITFLLAALTLGFFAWQQQGEHTYLKQVGQALDQAPDATAFSDRTLLQRVVRVGSYYALFLPAEIGGYAGLAPEIAVVGLSLLVLVAAFTGGVLLFLRGERFVPVVWFAYQGVLLIWRNIDARFYLPLLPFFLYLVWTGAAEIAAWLSRRADRAIPVFAFFAGCIPAVCILGTLFFFGREEIESATLIEWCAAAASWLALVVWLSLKMKSKAYLLVALAGVFFALACVRSVSENVVRERNRGPEPPGAGWHEFHRASIWLRDNAPPGEIVVSAKPSLVWFWSGLQGRSIPRTTNRSEAAAQISDANWLIVDAMAEDRIADTYLKPLLQANLDAWEPRWAEKATLVLHRKQSQK